jgi:hypothetical protein
MNDNRTGIQAEQSVTGVQSEKPIPPWHSPDYPPLNCEPHPAMRAMYWGKSLIMVVALGPLGAALAGVVWGRYPEVALGVSPGQLAFLAGGLLGLAGLFRRSAPDGQPWVERLAGACLLAYVVIAGVVEPLAFVGNVSEVFVSVAWLSPLIIGGVLLPSRGYWRAGLGCWSILFSGTAALSYNVSHVDSGWGFLIRWLA